MQTAPVKNTQLYHEGMSTLGGIRSPGTRVSLLPAELHTLLSGKACALGAGTGDPEREPNWQQRSRKIGEAAGDTQRPASPQALCSVILQQLPSGSWTRATETFVVVIAPNTYLHLAHLWAPNSEGSTLSVITRGPWGLRVGLRPQSLHLTQLRAAGIKVMDTKHPAPSLPSKAFDKYLALASRPPFVLPHC